MNEDGPRARRRDEADAVRRALLEYQQVLLDIESLGTRHKLCLCKDLKIRALHRELISTLAIMLEGDDGRGPSSRPPDQLLREIRHSSRSHIAKARLDECNEQIRDHRRRFWRRRALRAARGHLTKALETLEQYNAVYETPDAEDSWRKFETLCNRVGRTLTPKKLSGPQKIAVGTSLAGSAVGLLLLLSNLPRIAPFFWGADEPERANPEAQLSPAQTQMWGFTPTSTTFPSPATTPTRGGTQMSTANDQATEGTDFAD